MYVCIDLCVDVCVSSVVWCGVYRERVCSGGGVCGVLYLSVCLSVCLSPLLFWQLLAVFLSYHPQLIGLFPLCLTSGHEMFMQLQSLTKNDIFLQQTGDWTQRPQDADPQNSCNRCHETEMFQVYLPRTHPKMC